MNYPLLLKETKAKSAVTIRFLSRIGVISFIADAILMNLCFWVVNYLRTANLTLPAPYIKLLIAFNGVWLLVSMVIGKFRREKYVTFKSAIFTIVKSTLYMAYALTFMIIVLKLFGFSRGQTFGACLLYGFVQVSCFSVYFLALGKKIEIPAKATAARFKPRYQISPRKLIASFLLVTVAFFALNYWKRGAFALSYEYEQALWLVYGIWFIGSVYTGKFARRSYPNFIHALIPYIKALFLSIALLSIVFFLFRLSFYSRLHIFGTFFLVGMAEIFLYFLYCYLRFKTPHYHRYIIPHLLFI